MVMRYVAKLMILLVLLGVSERAIAARRVCVPAPGRAAAGDPSWRARWPAAAGGEAAARAGFSPHAVRKGPRSFNRVLRARLWRFRAQRAPPHRRTSSSLPRSRARALACSQGLSSHLTNIPGTVAQATKGFNACGLTALLKTVGVPIATVATPAVYAVLTVASLAAVLLLLGFDALGARLYILFLLCVTPVNYWPCVRARRGLFFSPARARARARFVGLAAPPRAPATRPLSGAPPPPRPAPPPLTLRSISAKTGDVKIENVVQILKNTAIAGGLLLIVLNAERKEKTKAN